jgi:hypothetical protein
MATIIKNPALVHTALPPKKNLIIMFLWGLLMTVQILKALAY